MKEFEHIDLKKEILNYNEGIFHSIGNFLDENYEHINGRNNVEISKVIVKNLDIHSYKTEEEDLFITRRKKYSYPFHNYGEDAWYEINEDEVILLSSNLERIVEFKEKLKESFEEQI